MPENRNYSPPLQIGKSVGFVGAALAAIVRKQSRLKPLPQNNSASIFAVIWAITEILKIFFHKPIDKEHPALSECVQTLAKEMSMTRTHRQARGFPRKAGHTAQIPIRGIGADEVIQ